MIVMIVIATCESDLHVTSLKDSWETCHRSAEITWCFGSHASSVSSSLCISHPANLVVSMLNKERGSSAVQVLKSLGPQGESFFTPSWICSRCSEGAVPLSQHLEAPLYHNCSCLSPPGLDVWNSPKFENILEHVIRGRKKSNRYALSDPQVRGSLLASPWAAVL